jgi:hypothetical protein
MCTNIFIWKVFTILSFLKHAVSETGPVSCTIYKSRKVPTQLGPLERNSLSCMISKEVLIGKCNLLTSNTMNVKL